MDIGPLPWEFSEGVGEAAGIVGKPTGNISFILKDILTRQTVTDRNEIGNSRDRDEVKIALGRLIYLYLFFLTLSIVGHRRR
jgi:hypothetical protein